MTIKIEQNRQAMGQSPSSQQQQWQQRVESLGCVVSGDSNSEIHHVAGCSAVYNDIAIGHWFVLPLHHQLHRTGLITVRNSLAYFKELYGSQVQLFKGVCEQYRALYGALPFDDSVMDSICSTAY